MIREKEKPKIESYSDGNAQPNSPPVLGSGPEKRSGSALKEEKQTTGVSPIAFGNAQQNSPPVLGGVPGRRGGKDINHPGPPQISNLPHLKKFRKELRRKLTPAEAYLWKYLQKSKAGGRKFRRQHSVGNYILDFYCPEERIAVELDGQAHFSDQGREYDYQRKQFLQKTGIRVLRFENRQVFEELEWVLHSISSNFGWHNAE